MNDEWNKMPYYSRLLSEWDDEKNDGVVLTDYSFGSNKKFWWKCAKGHSWNAPINHRSHGCGCPYCSNNKVLKGFNDLESQIPSLAEEWNYKKNAKNPSEYTKKSGKKVWWICQKGHEWQANISDRANGNGCPYCAGKKPVLGENDLKTVYPSLADEWNYEKNNNAPENYMPNAGRKVWWKCKNGHEWEATIDSRSKNKGKGNGCPYCAGQRVLPGENDLATLYPEYLSEWDYEKNKKYTPQSIMPKSGKKVWWKCPKNHSFFMTPNEHIGMGFGCPKCMKELKTSFPEQAIYYYFRDKINVENRYRFQGKEIDIWFPDFMLAIEYDGMRYHKGKKLESEKKKDDFLKKHGVRVLRIKEIQGFSSTNAKTNAVTDVIYRNLSERPFECIKNVICSIGDYLKQEFDYTVQLDVDLERDRFDIWGMYYSLEKQNSLKNLYPEIAEQWCYEKNGDLLPENVSYACNLKVWWQCERGHCYEANVAKRTLEGTNCPYCSNQKVLVGYNDLATTCQNILKEWDYEENVDLSPEMFSAGSVKQIWWKCKKGHKWQARIHKRCVSGQGCPYCIGKKVWVGDNDLATRNPELAEQWCYEKNSLKPTEVTLYSNKEVWWKCRKCKHVWQAKVNSRSRGIGCPKCRINHS